MDRDAEEIGEGGRQGRLTAGERLGDGDGGGRRGHGAGGGVHSGALTRHCHCGERACSRRFHSSDGREGVSENLPAVPP